MAWEIEFTDEFGQWWTALSADQQDDIAYSVLLLAELGPSLGFPHSSKVSGSRYAAMRELRTQSAGKPLRTLCVFDPLRTAILLIGGDKTGNDRWYEQFVPMADRLYQNYLDELQKPAGAIDGVTGHLPRSIPRDEVPAGTRMVERI